MAAFLLMMATSSAWQMFLSSFLTGLGVGALLLMQSLMWPLYFGRENIGASERSSGIRG